MSGDESRPDVKVVPGGRRSTSTAIQRRAQVVAQTMSGVAVPDIASKVGVSERHVRRILREPSVRELLQALDSETLRVVARRAAALSAGAVYVLGEIMAAKSSPPAARVSAASKVLETTIKVAELTELSERIERLEAKLAPGGPTAWRPRAT